MWGRKHREGDITLYLNKTSKCDLNLNMGKPEKSVNVVLNRM